MFYDVFMSRYQFACQPVFLNSLEMMKNNSRSLAGRRSLSAYPFFLLAAVLFIVLSGCAGVKDMSGRTNPAELYETGMKSYLDGRYVEAESAFRTLLDEHPISQYSLDAQLMLGDVCYEMEKFDDASSYYTSFVALHPVHPRAAYALFKKGMSHFKEVLTFDRDQTSTRKALYAFEDLIAVYPDSPYYSKSKDLITFLRRRLAERELYVAEFYYKSKNYKGALGRFRDILENYPDSGLGDKALYYVGLSYTKLGEAKLAVDTFSTLISEYPESPFAEGATKAKEKIELELSTGS